MIEKNFAIYFFLLCVFVLCGIPRANAALFGEEGLDPSFCDQTVFRQTVVYIDDMMMVEKKTDWIVRLGTKLQASLMPGEPVTVVRLSPEQGISKEIWRGCWPDYSADKIRSIRNEFHFFSKNPLNVLKDQQKYFLRDFGAALVSIHHEAEKPEEKVLIDPDHPPTKQIIRALTSDEARFAQTRVTLRVILYSDLAENSDLGSVFKTPIPEQLDYGQRLGTRLRWSVFYIYGVASDIKGGGNVHENIVTYWTRALKSMNASIGGIGADLNVPNVHPVAAKMFTISTTISGVDLSGRISLLYGDRGELVDSWIGLDRLGGAALNGTFRCRGTTDGSQCELRARTIGPLVTLNLQSENVDLAGMGNGTYSGEVGVSPTLYKLVGKDDNSITSSESTDSK